jgi:GTP-binding protein HflX
MDPGFRRDGMQSCFVLHLDLPHASGDIGSNVHRSNDAMLAEAVGLAAAINLDVVHAETIRINTPNPGALIPPGTRDRIKALILDLAPTVVIVNHALSPVQQRNLETEWDVKVIDRTGLILEIFGARAQSASGKIQVQLAALQYQRSRLVRTWTHLERQRGGTSGIGGPGETQLEIDRRLIDDKVARLKRDLETVQARRDVERGGRDKVPFKTVAIIGYTNAGKSTLFNRLTGADVFAKDLLFATLDTTMRRVKLPGGEMVILADTVGFISDLPTSLIAAFRATLDQLQYADVILHVRDIIAPDFVAQARDVQAVMNDLGINAAEDPRVIEVWNKVDGLIEHEEPQEQTVIPAQAGIQYDDSPRVEIAEPWAPACAGTTDRSIVRVSALTGFGMADLLAAIEAKIMAGYTRQTLRVAAADGARLAWLHAHTRVVDEHIDGDEMILTVDISDPDQGRYAERFS